jgi:hypothetical protein
VPGEGVGDVAEVAISVVGVEVAVLRRQIAMFLLSSLGMRVSSMQSIGGDDSTGSEDMELHGEFIGGVA